MAAMVYISCTPLLFSQNTCEGYLPFEKDFSFEQTHYDARGKVSSISHSIVAAVEPTRDGSRALIHSKLIDEKGQEIGQRDFQISCKGGVFRVNVNDLLNPGMLDAYQSMDITACGEGLQFPAELQVDQSLPGGSTVLEVASNGTAVVTLTYTVKDRKVEAREQITTSAGTFDCFRLRETVDYQTMLLTHTFTTVSWFARNVGLVKQETYDQKGKLSGWMELTKTGE